MHMLLQAEQKLTGQLCFPVVLVVVLVVLVVVLVVFFWVESVVASPLLRPFTDFLLEPMNQ